AEHDRLAHGQLERGGAGLRHVGDHLGVLAAGHPQQVAPAEGDGSRGRLQDPRDDLGQRRLAGPVGAEQRAERALGHAQVHALQHGPAAVAEPHPGDVESAHAAALLAMMRLMKTGAPTKATTMPTGTTEGAMTVRPTVSAASSSRPPLRKENGSRKRWSAPMASRAMCGPTSPTKPMTPQKETTTEASTTARAISPTRRALTLTPRLRAASSPAKATALRSLANQSSTGRAASATTPTTRTSCQPASLTEPKVHRTMPCRVLSSARNRRAAVSASKSWVSAMPSSSRVAVAIDLAEASPSTTADTASGAATAPPMTGHEEDPAAPPVSRMTEAAPNAAAGETPRVNGLTSGFRSRPCMTAPDTDSAAPAVKASSARGSRRSVTMP